MSADERGETPRSGSTTDSVAGFLAAAALFAAFLAVVWYPGRLGPAAMLVALIAAALGAAQRRLAAAALVVAAVCWLVGMIIAVATERPIF
jgi:hypothetical protein